MAGQVFISYRRSYGDRVDRLVGALTDAGYKGFELFRDVDDITEGDGWEAQLRRALGQARLLLAVVGPGWARDRFQDWVRQELEAALDAGIRVLVAAFPDGRSELSGLPARLQPILDGQVIPVQVEPTPADVDALVRAMRRAGIHPARPADPWSAVLRDADIGRSADGLRAHVAAFAAPRPTGSAGPAPVVVVDGPPGSGRSCALRELAADPVIAASGVAVAFHTPLATGHAPAPGSVVFDWAADVLRWAHRHGPASTFTAVARAVTEAARAGLDGRRFPSDVVQALPVADRAALLTPRKADGQPKAPTQVVATAMTLFDRLAGTVPLVLVVDDLDRVDAASVELVRQLAERVAEESALRILLVTAHAPGDLLADLPADRVARIPLGTPELMEGFLDRCQVGRGPVRDLLATAGAVTPVLAVAYLDHLRLTGRIRPSTTDDWQLDPADDGPRPPTLEEAIDATIDRFVAPTWQRVVELGAVIGQVFSLAVALQVAAGPTAELDACFAELQAADPDEVVVRCRWVNDEAVVGLVSSAWSGRLRDRHRRVEGGAATGLLAETLAAAAGSRFDDWMAAAALFDAADDPGRAGDAYLHAARAARLTLSNEAAARAYGLAANQLWESAQRSDGPRSDLVRGLVRIAYCYFRAANLLALAAGDARSRATATRLRRTGDDRLTDAERTLDATRDLLAQWMEDPSPLPDLDLLIIDDEDVQSEEEVRVALQADTLAGFVALQRGRNGLGALDADPDEVEAHLLAALRSSERGLSGWLRRQLVVGASAGLALALARRSRHTAGTPVAARAAPASFLHGVRAVLVQHRLRPQLTEAQAIRLLDQAVEQVLESRAMLAADLGLGALAAHVTHRRRGTADADPDDLVVDVARLACPPSRQHHATRVEELALALLAAQGAALGLADDPTVPIDVRIVAHAHDLFRDQDGSRLLAMASDVDLGVDGRAWDDPLLLHGEVAAAFLAHDLGLDDALGDRFDRIRLAITTHTVGLDDPSVPDDHRAFIRVLHLADMRATTGTDDPEAGRTWQQALAGDLDGAYLACFRHRARRIRAQGRVLAPVTGRLLGPIDLREPVGTPVPPGS